MITCIDLVDNSEKKLKPEDLTTLELSNVWLQLEQPTKEELDAVSEKSGIDINFMQVREAVQNIGLRWEQDWGIINFGVISEIVDAKRVFPIIIAFSKDFMITVETGEYKGIIDLAKARMSKTKADPPAITVYYILDEMISNNFSHLEKLEGVIANLEEEIMEKPEPTTVRKLFKLKSRMVSFNKILWYERGLVFNLRKAETACMSAKARSHFDTAHEYLTRQIDIVETYREIMTDAINVYLSAISNRINSAIKALTVVIFYLTIVTTITSFPNTVATFFGISQFGNTNAVVVFSVLALSVVLPLLWLWRRKWIRLDEQSASA
ncbi:MAG TPA: CorA family divalent cation transporter [Candidatus Bathyarchaeia archaeon]|nr:CorA family divalent cation transporter [Candidatus Bathyarchaeia archaeon]